MKKSIWYKNANTSTNYKERNQVSTEFLEHKLKRKSAFKSKPNKNNNL